MMDGMRKAGKSFVGRIVIAIMFGFLIFSFALWGIGDIFRGYGSRVVATVGSVEITPEAYRSAFQTELQALGRRYGHPISAEQAVAAGLDRQVLGRLLSDATLDAKASALGLGISQDTIVQALLTDSSFKGTNGQFDRARFNEALRQSGYTEAGFLASQRGLYLRQQIAFSIAGLPAVPDMLANAISAYQDEHRAVDFLVIGKDQIEAPGTPDDTALKPYFDENIAAFRTPEYRKLGYLLVTPTELADPAAISDADIKARYEADLETRYTVPERRAVRQLVFKTEGEARAALETIKSGKTFDEIIAAEKRNPADSDLGLVARAGIADRVVADAAFALEPGATSDVVSGTFGFVLVTVSSVEPGSVKSIETVSDTIRADLAESKVKERIRDLHDKIEDQRAAAKPLAEIAKDVGLTLHVVDALDREGKAPDHADALAIPERDALLQATFSTDVGVDTDAIATRSGGFVWFDVMGITPQRDRTLEEAKADVISAWTMDETATRVAKKAQDLAGVIKDGKTLADLARELGAEVKSVSGVRRSGPAEGLSRAALGQIFAVAPGISASAIGNSPLERVVFTVTKAGRAASATALADHDQIMKQIKASLSDDYAGTYVGRTQQELGVTVHDKVLGLALGIN